MRPGENRDDISSYYYFDDTTREVRFRRYDMPTPWMNYLSNGVFHAMLSQAGGGPVFHRSPQIWRLTRYRFFHLPTDRPGPYIYIRDGQEYWCPTCEPAHLKPERWEAAHGLGYSRFSAARKGIAAELTYFVGAGADALVWRLDLANESTETKELDIFACVEFGMFEFMRELQWQCYNKHQVAVDYRPGTECLIYKYGVEMQPRPEETPLAFLAGDLTPCGYDGDRDEFIGSYRSESDPWAIEHGGCTGSTLKGGDPYGALQFRVELGPGEKKRLNIFLGSGLTESDINDTLSRLRSPGFVDESLRELKDSWEARLETFQCTVPDAAAMRQINTWNPYQAQRNFLFSRNISFYATGTFRGVGFRDTAQDILAEVPFDLEAARAKTRLLLGQQYNDGHVNHYFFPLEGWDPVTSVHSDDHLWPAMAVHKIAMESGDTGFLEEVVPWYDGGEATVYEHLHRAVRFTLEHRGERGLPLMLRSDWNDQMFRVCRQGKGESFWTAMQFGLVLRQLAELAQLSGRGEDAVEYLAVYERQKEIVNAIGWDGRWYRRAIMDDGRYLGSDVHDEAKIWLNAQSWAVLSGMAPSERAAAAMDSVREMLDTPLGVKLVGPPIVNFPDPKDPLTNYNPGTGENGAVFCHANTWAVMAECLLGRPDIAWKYYRQLIPALAMEKAGIWRYKAEPYVYVSNIFGPESDKFGLANVSWLTGTAAWMYVAVTEYILGVRAAWKGLEIDPCLPSGWPGARIRRRFRGCLYDIEISAGEPNASGSSILVDGRAVEGKIVPHEEGRVQAVVKVSRG